MTQDEILDMFRQQADSMPPESPTLNAVILELAQILAQSRGRLPEETFETLVRIGAVLYKEGRNRFDARSDVAEIMKKSAEDRGNE
ncbi:hypothetical protein D3870_12900 [Noviherbaspirillum cavernae]|uniref:Uncharacterized protein n=1 Tax=Noviherbaspirillum cavernae TaxID=2320862 RepID=A0A418X309_9BURK|nr:hypothetical protein [Noviherbaspirillum cavernae]RJG06781.1 hypothetical protein D3870_12900 [Noviherbaspirillum cavernae]